MNCTKDKVYFVSGRFPHDMKKVFISKSSKVTIGQITIIIYFHEHKNRLVFDGV